MHRARAIARASSQLGHLGQVVWLQRRLNWAIIHESSPESSPVQNPGPVQGIVLPLIPFGNIQWWVQIIWHFLVFLGEKVVWPIIVSTCIVTPYPTNIGAITLPVCLCSTYIGTWYGILYPFNPSLPLPTQVPGVVHVHTLYPSYAPLLTQVPGMVYWLWSPNWLWSPMPSWLLSPLSLYPLRSTLVEERRKDQCYILDHTYPPCYFDCFNSYTQVTHILDLNIWPTLLLEPIPTIL